MSGEAIGYKEIKKCRKNHTCFWCGETIKCGESYRRWCWADDGLEEIKVHPECGHAWNEAANEEGGFYEAMPYEHKRGKWFDN